MDMPDDIEAAIRRDAIHFARRTDSTIEAEDLAQEGRLAVLAWLSRGKDWSIPARKVARYGMTNYIRKRIRRPAVNLAVDLALLTPRRVDLEAALDAREVVASLSASHREAILSTLDGHPSQTCEALGLTRGVLESRLQRARAACRAKLGEGYDHMSRKCGRRCGAEARRSARRRKKKLEASG